MDDRQAKVTAAPAKAARRDAAAERRPAPPPARRTVSRHAGAGAPAVRGGGQPLDERTRARMEARLGHDFGRIRVHHDGEVARLADDAQARAFTAGDDIVFAPGEYAPDRPDGERLLAHELAHSVQQTGATGAGDAADGRALEGQASAAAEVAARGGRAEIGPAARAPAVQRDSKPGVAEVADRTEARASLRTFLVEQRERQGGKQLIVTPAVVLGIEGFFRADPSARLSVVMYVRPLLDQTVDLDGFAAKVAGYLPASVPSSDTKPKPVGPKLDTSSPPGAIAKVGRAVEKAAAAKPSPEEQEAQWRRDDELGRARKAEGAKGPIPGLPGLILSPMIDPFMIARVVKELKGEPAAAAQGADHAAVDKLASGLDPDLLVPAEARASRTGAGSWAEASQVARSLGRELELAHRKNNSTVELRLGGNYRGAKDRLALIHALRRLVKDVRDALPARPTRVDAVIIFFGDQQVQRVGLWSSD